MSDSIAQTPAYTVQELSGANGSVQTYDANAAMEFHRGWAYGDFIRNERGESLGTTPFEIRMGALAAGESRNEWPDPGPGKCVTVITTGRMRYEFKLDDSDGIAILEAGPGEVVVWDNVIPHRWTVLEDLSYVCVRTLRD